MSAPTNLSWFPALADKTMKAALARIERPELAGEFVLVAATGLLAFYLAPLLKRWAFRQLRFEAHSVLETLVSLAATILGPLLWALSLEIAVVIGQAFGLPMDVAGSAIALLVAWIVIRLASNVVRSRVSSLVVSGVAWLIAALDITGLLKPVEAHLAGARVKYGNVDISALNVVRALIVLAVLLWLATFALRHIERFVRRSAAVGPSLGALLVRTLKLLLPAAAIVATLPVLGIDLTAVTVLGGALAVGVGLGLQKAVANLVSGFVLLSSGSVRPGDVLAVKDKAGAETFGRVMSVGAYYLSLRTRAGKEYLIPNETFLIEGIENWSHTDQRIRLKIPFGVSYEANPREVAALALEAARAIPRVLAEPAPACQLTAFGDSAIAFELRIWIDDPMNGIAKVKSECLMEIWDLFKAHGIRFPFPQRDIHVASLAVDLDRIETPARRQRQA